MGVVAGVGRLVGGCGSVCVCVCVRALARARDLLTSSSGEKVLVTDVKKGQQDVC